MLYLLREKSCFLILLFVCNETVHFPSLAKYFLLHRDDPNEKTLDNISF